ncbi:MAG: 4-amino-4-deoxy-L-arabinose transferase-like glycosyltransferase, partial [Francisellaceae bacterium]
MQNYNKTWVFDLAFLSLFLIVFFLLFVGGHQLISPDETRYTGIAWDMYKSGNYITPKLAGSPFLGKPILFYWW